MDCISMNYKDRYHSDAKCELRRKYYNPYSCVCRDFIENNVSRSELERRYTSTDPNIRKDYSKVQPDNTCYLTTAICSCLNYSDDCNYLETLRGFRDNVMLKDKRYYKLLAEYNAIGPMIAENLYCDKNNKEVSLNLLLNYIVPVYFKIRNRHFKEAIKVYTKMVTDLKQYYGLDNIDLIEIDDDLPKIKTKKNINKLFNNYRVVVK